MNSRRLAPRVFLGLAFLGAYVLSTHLGLMLRVDFGGLTPLWPASGVGLVLLLKLGLSWWPLIVAGEFITALSLDQPVTMGLAGGAAQSLEALMAVWILRQGRIDEWFRDLPETVHLCFLVCLVPPTVAASIGTLAQVMHGLGAVTDWQSAWFTWWLGDAMGLLIVAPFLMVWWRWPFHTVRQFLEWACLAALLVATGLVLNLMLPARGDQLFFLLLPFVAWLAMRFRAAGATSATVILAALVFGVTGGSDEQFRTAVYIGFVGASAYTGYLIAAVLASQRRLLGELRYRADHDAVTGIHNRSRLESELRKVTARGNTREVHALLYVDLDHFKLVNDSCGHETGDRLLRELAGELSAVVPPHAIFARLGGDEFAVLVPGAGESEAQALAEELRRYLMDFRFVSGEYRFSLGASIGIACFHPGEPAAAVLSRADIACYSAKDEGRDRVHLYRTEDLAMRRHHSELEWVTQFQSAMARGELVLFGQRIRSLADGSGGPEMYEVLLRRIENGRAVSPGRFLPVANRYGLMPAVDRWVMTEAFALLSRYRGRDFVLSINLAAATLDRPRFRERVEALAAEYGIDPSRVCFEVTETIAIRNMTRAVEAIGQLTSAGFRFALDDFGSGVASFGYMNQLPLHFVKVDGQFVRNLPGDDASRIIVSSLKELAALRGIECVAECVESQEALGELERIGVEFAQGFHIHEPESLEDLLEGVAGHPVSVPGRDSESAG